MISKCREVGVHIPSLLEKMWNEVDTWWFGQTTGAVALVHLPHPLLISVVDVVRNLGGRSQLCVSMSLGDLPHTYSCTWCYYSKKKMEPKREARLAEELGSLYSNSNIFMFFKRERCENQHHFQTKIRFTMRETYRDTHIYPQHL
jgi:hypothetical protein